MFNVTLATYNGFDLQFQLDMDDALWLAVRPVGGNENTAAAPFGSEAKWQIDNNYGGSVQRYVDEKVIPEGTVFLRAHFGKDAPPVTDWRGELQVELLKLTVNTGTMQISKLP